MAAPALSPAGAVSFGADPALAMQPLVVLHFTLREKAKKRNGVLRSRTSMQIE
jgi:hypothetical protein